MSPATSPHSHALPCRGSPRDHGLCVDRRARHGCLREVPQDGTGTFPAQQGTAVRKGIGQQCRACHTDVHLGQLDQRCELSHHARLPFSSIATATPSR